MKESVRQRILGIVNPLGGYIINTFVSNFPSHRIRLWFYRRFLHFDIGQNTTILMGAKFTAVGGVTIGKHTVINGRCYLDSRGSIVIGDNVSISTASTILTADHDLNSANFETRKRPVRIEDYVFIGHGATLLPGVFVGRGTIIAAGAVVVGRVPSLSIFAGVPAIQIGKREESSLGYILEHRPRFQ